MWNTLEIKTCDHIEKEYTNIREEASQYLSSIKDLVKGDKVDDNLYAQDIILADNEKNCRLLKIDHPILSNTDLLKIKNIKKDGFKVAVLSMLYYKKYFTWKSLR